MKSEVSRNGRHAIVIGGSIVGLMAAEILSRHFEQVTILERDALPDDLTVRKGAPQAKHIHILLARGRQEIEAIYPGIGAQMIAQGAVEFDMGEEIALMVRGHWVKRDPLGIEVLSLSRVFLEHCIRQRTMKNENVQLLTGASVTDLLTDEAKTNVTGVRIDWRRAATENGPRELQADLVIDASGRSSKTPQWLEKLGYPSPQETVVNPFLGYATRRYKRPSSYTDDWKLMAISSVPTSNPRAGAISQEEDGNWIVTLSGTAKEYPPTNEAEFLEFSRLIHSELHELLKNSEPLSPIAGYQRTENRWRHYEKNTRFPGQYAVMGDAFCGFNPIYGQGMSVGAMSVQALDKQLTEMGNDLSDFATPFHNQLAKIAQQVWLLATSEDARWPTTTGIDSDSWLRRANYWYIDKVLDAAVNNFNVRKTFVEVNQLLVPPTKLFHPRIMWHALRS